MVNIYGYIRVSSREQNESRQLLYDTNIHIENDFTLWFLNQLGVEWEKTDFVYFQGYVEYFRKLGFLKV